jgi:hypothetical protein
VNSAAKGASSNLRLFLSPDTFFVDVCNSDSEDFESNSPRTLTSKALSNQFDFLNIKFESDPDAFDVDGGFFCVSQNFPTKRCRAYERTLTMPKTLPSGTINNGFFIGINPDCIPRQKLNVAVTTKSGTTVETLSCADASFTNGFGVLSDEVVKSVVITSNFRDYFIYLVGLASTDCSTRGSKGSKGSRGSKGSKST